MTLSLEKERNFELKIIPCLVLTVHVEQRKRHKCRKIPKEAELVLYTWKDI